MKDAVAGEARIAHAVGAEAEQDEVGVDAARVHLAAAHDQTVVGVLDEAPRAVGGEGRAVDDAGAEVEDRDAVAAQACVLAAVGVEAHDGDLAVARVGVADVLDAARDDDLVRSQ